jgi:predicted RNase H-like HicB family nuclease
MQHYTALIVKSDGWYAATVKELSGVHSQGKTIEEVKENLKEAIQMVIESNILHFKELGDEYIEEDILVNV